MSEVLGDAEPPFDEDDRPAFDSFGDPDGDSLDPDEFGDFDEFGDAPEPGQLRRAIASIATPQALAISALVIAAASLLSMPSVGITVSALQLRHLNDTGGNLFVQRAEAVAQLIVAIIAALLAIAARRTRTPAEADRPPAWVANASGAAILVAFVSAVFAATAFAFAATSHLPANENQLLEQSAPAAAFAGLVPGPQAGAIAGASATPGR